MPGISNITNVTMAQIEELVNVTTLPEFFIKVNHDVYNGVFFSVLLGVLFLVLFFAGQSRKDQLLNNMMYASAVVTVLAFILRGIYIVREGAIQGMLTDPQLWIFPIMTAIIATILWATKD